MMYVYFIIITLAFLSAIHYISEKLNILSQPNERSSHDKPKSRLGGLAIFLSIVLSIFLIKEIHFPIYPLIGFILIFIVGLYDDLYDLKPIIKLIGQTIACALLLYGGYYFSIPYIPDDISIIGNFILYLALLNAVNFMDGLDGLVGGYFEMFLFTLIIIVTNFNIEYSNIYFMLILMMIVLSFLIFNLYPSSIFMGDSGSLSLGYLLIFLSNDILKDIDYGIFIFIILFLFPIIDIVNVVIRRIIHKKSIFSADKRHIHHIVYRGLNSHCHTFPVTVLYGIMAIIMINAYFFCKICIF